MERPTWDEFFFAIMHAVSTRSTCDRGRTAAVIVKDNHVLATGYAGAPSGLPHCDEVGHQLIRVVNLDQISAAPDEEDRTSTHCVRTIHAEQNAILHAAKYGISLEGSTLYLSMEPCRTCAMSIVSVGIKKVVAEKRYHAAQESREILQKCGVELVVVSDQVKEYAE